MHVGQHGWLAQIFEVKRGYSANSAARGLTACFCVGMVGRKQRLRMYIRQRQQLKLEDSLATRACFLHRGNMLAEFCHHFPVHILLNRKQGIALQT